MIRRAQPSLAELWQTRLAHLERQGVGNAAELARSQAIAALIARNVRISEPRESAGPAPHRVPRSRCRGLACASS